MSGAKRNAKKGNRCILLVWRGTTANVYSSRQGYLSLVFRRTQTHANFNRPVFEVFGIFVIREQTGEYVGRALELGCPWYPGRCT